MWPHAATVDLRGYLLLPAALPAEFVAALNTTIDKVPPLSPRAWHGHVHRNDYAESWGYNLQNIVEAGEPFERLIDWPGFLPWVQRYAGHDGLFIDEALVTIRWPGQGVSLHSGAHKRRVRTQYRVATGGADGISDLDSEVIQADSFYHLTVTYDGEWMTIFLNGELQSYRQRTGNIRTTSLPFLMGQMLPDNTEYNYKGILDEVKIFDYALTPIAIAMLFNESITAIETPFHKDFQLTLTPNPASDILSIRQSGDFVENGIISVFDLQGRLVYEQNTGSEPAINLTISNWHSGTSILA